MEQSKQGPDARRDAHAGREPPVWLRQVGRVADLGTVLVLIPWLVGAPVEASTSRPPNVVFVIADDLGIGDLGCYGQTKIRTPNIDHLAAEGMRFRQHYSGNAVCAPSRCVLMTGLHPGHAWIRDNQEVQPEGQAPLPAGTMTLARLFQRHGYATGAFGKWGLGGPGSAGDPLRQGFDRFFGYNCQRQAHNYYPTYLWDNDHRVTLNNPPFPAHQRFPAGADATQPASYERYQGREYAADRIMEQARAFIRENRDRPFFCFVPTTVPHLALQVPGDSLAEYAGVLPDEPYLGGQSYLPHPRPHAAYAAMITRLDREVGRLVDCVRELGLEDQTLFVFTSDNGPLYDRLGGTDTGFFDSASGLRGRKGSLYEGGVRVPCIVRWPGRIPPGTTHDRVTGFEDWLPTLMELAGFKSDIPKGLDGISFAPTLLGRRQRERPFLYREFPGYGGQQSIRLGDWKAVRQNLLPRGANARPPDLRIRLYQLREDPTEARDVAMEHLRRVARLERLLRREHRVSALFPLPALDELTARP